MANLVASILSIVITKPVVTYPGALLGHCQSYKCNPEVSLLPQTNLCLEIYAVTIMADLTKFRQTYGMFMDLTILANFSQSAAPQFL